MGIFFIIVVFFVYIMIKAQHETLAFNEEDGEYYKIPLFFPYTSSNASYLFVHLGVKMLSIDMEDSSLKRDFVLKYVRAKFNTTSLDFRDDYLTALNKQFRDIDLANYLKSKLKTTEKRIELTHFLCGVAFANGLIKSSEKKFIENFSLLLGLSLADINDVVTIYFEKQEKRNQEEKAKASSQSSSSIYNAEYKKRKYAAILDIPENADLKKIKTAFRLLAKKWHPDLMINQSEAEQKYAIEKFREIHEAYEYLSKLK